MSSQWLLKPLEGDQGDDIYFTLPSPALRRDLTLHCRWEDQKVEEDNVSTLANYTIIQWGPHVRFGFLERPLVEPDQQIREFLLNFRPKATTVRANRARGLWLWFTY